MKGAPLRIAIPPGLASLDNNADIAGHYSGSASLGGLSGQGSLRKAMGANPALAYMLRRPGAADMQGYTDRLVKLIPGEVVGIYLAGIGIIPSTAPRGVVAGWAFVCLGLVVLARAYATSDNARGVPPEWKAVIISAISFVVWTYTMPGPFQRFGLAVPYIGSLLILVWTFVAPYIYVGECAAA